MTGVASRVQSELLKQQGVRVMAVGVGDQVDRAELAAIATDPSHVWLVADYSALTHLHKEVKRRTCAGQSSHAHSAFLSAWRS